MNQLMIKVDDLRGAAIAQLLAEHLASMRAISPPGSVHALDLEALRKPEITFWSAWDDDTGTLCGCGALKELDATHGEVKSMRTASGYLRRGVAVALLQKIIATAEMRGYTRLSLETGSMRAFEPAHALYARFGFQFCGPFGGYVNDPNSVFMTKVLVAND